ncbi:MAG: ABC transporter permease [Alistipes sp.]|nr:ABC transporter permease [Candidatus Minthomonas equi]
MNIGRINLVLGREFAIRVKKKSFILTTILTPIFFAALMIVPSLIMLNDNGDKRQSVVVVDKSGIVVPYLKDSENIKYTVSDTDNLEVLKSDLRQENSDADILAVFSELDENNNLSLATYSVKQINGDAKNAISHCGDDAVQAYKLSKYDIANLDAIMADLKYKVKVNTYMISEEGEEKENSNEISMALSYIMASMIYIFVFMFGNMVMQSVIQEKSNRIVEVIISSVKPFELMIGKIFGVACVAVVQFLIWIVLTFGIVSVVSVASGIGSDPEQMVAAADATQIIASGDMANPVADITSSGMMSTISSTLGNINFPFIIGCFLIYFVLGYLLFASMFAAVGSAVDNEADTSQLTLPVTIPLILGLFIMLHTFQHPESSLSVWASIIPWTSPMVMLARIPFENVVPMWQLLLSIFLLLVTFVGTVYLAGKIYRTGILMYGKKATWKDLMKWLKF